MASLRRLAIGLSRSCNSHVVVSLRPSSATSIISQCCSSPRIGVFSGFSSNNYIHNQALDIDFSNEESKRRLFNRLLYRSKQRGFLELDLVLGKWVEDHIHLMDKNGVKALADVLDLENPDLWKWLTGQEQPPESVNINPVFCAVREKVMNNLHRHAAPEARAVPGQPWVRGWDDIKKGRDGPISGNQ